MLLADNY